MSEEREVYTVEDKEIKIIYKGREMTIEEYDKEIALPVDTLTKDFLKKVYDAGGVIDGATISKIFEDFKKEKGLTRLPLKFWDKIESEQLIIKIKVPSLRAFRWALTSKGLKALSGPNKV